MNRLQAAEQFRKALQLFAQTLSDEQALEISTVYPQWTTGRLYNVGELVAYNNNSVDDPQLYRCIQGHKSQDDWTPKTAVSLWSAIGLADDSIPIWSQPTGAHDAYNAGDKVHYPDSSGSVYESKINNNVWAPDVYPDGWELV